MRTSRTRRNQIIAKSIVYTTMLSLLAGFAVSHATEAAYADPITEEECFPAVLMLRGSGETEVPVAERNYPQGSTGSDVLIKTNGAEGPTLARALEALVAEADPAETISKLRFVGIDYPALDVNPPEPEPYPDMSDLPPDDAGGITAGTNFSNAVDALTHYFPRYPLSYQEGGKNIVNFIEDDRSRGCYTQYILMGYSQGALAARVAMNLEGNNTNQIMGSYLIGDPSQKANGASTDRQRSFASTGWSRDGMFRYWLDQLTFLPSPLSVMKGKWVESDSTAYRDDGIGNFASRSLCHQFDPVCWSKSMFVPDEEAHESQHTNYFVGDADDPGLLDLWYDIPEFDLQLQKLAESQPGNPRERALKKEISFAIEPTLYNIANMRPDDACSWDEGSDGSFEAVNLPCGIYSVAHTDDTAKMTVKVLDSFGITHTYSSEEQVIDPAEIANLTSVPYDKWMRFESLVAPTECVSAPHDSKRDFYGSLPTGHVKSVPCLNSPDPRVQYDATQVFKKIKAQTTFGEPTDHYLWGYDDDFRLTPMTNNMGDAYSKVVGGVELRTNSSDNNYIVAVELGQIRESVPYYQFKFSRTTWEGTSEWCATHNTNYQKYTLEECDVTEDRQMFKGMVVDQGYGALSLDRDVTAPTKVTGFEVTELNKTYVKFRWDLSTDDRYTGVNYYRMEAYDTARGGWGSYSYTYHPANTRGMYLSASNSKVRIQACDHSLNCSEPVEAIVPWAVP